MLPCYLSDGMWFALHKLHVFLQKGFTKRERWTALDLTREWLRNGINSLAEKLIKMVSYVANGGVEVKMEMEL